MKKILIVNTHLRTGGIATSLTNLLNELSKSNLYSIDLLIFNSNLNKRYEIPKNINILKPPFWLDIWFSYRKDYKNLSLRKILSMMIHMFHRVFSSDKIVNFLISKLHKLKGYDAAIAFSNDIYTVNTNMGCNDFVIKCVEADKKIAWVHNDPYKLGFNYKNCKTAYKDFNSVVNVSYACKKMFDEIIPEYSHKSKVVYNITSFDKIKEKCKNSPNPYTKGIFNIVTVARLANSQKRIDRAIECCRILKNSGINNFQWHMVGDGPDKEMLQNLAKEKQVDDVFIFEGHKDNPYQYMYHADIFVLPSDYESFGLVLAESLSVNTPVISTNFPCAQEVVSDKKNGLLVEINSESLASELIRVLSNPSILKQMEKYVEEHPLSNETALKQFEDLLID